MPNRMRPVSYTHLDVYKRQEQANEIKKQYTTNYTNYTTYDKSSIMVLDLPRNLLVTASTYTPANKTLSQTDINLSLIHI